MTTLPETTLELSFPKALTLAGCTMLCFVFGCWLIGIPLEDPLLVGFLAVFAAGMTPVFAAAICFMLGCKIDHEGMRPAAPSFYQRILRWDDIASARKVFGAPFYLIRGRQIGAQVLLPSGFLLKNPDSLRLLVEQFAPDGNIARITLAKN